MWREPCAALHEGAHALRTVAIKSGAQNHHLMGLSKGVCATRVSDARGAAGWSTQHAAAKLRSRSRREAAGGVSLVQLFMMARTLCERRPSKWGSAPSLDGPEQRCVRDAGKRRAWGCKQERAARCSEAAVTFKT